MKQLLFIALVACGCWAQTLTITCPQAAPAGANLVCPVTLAGGGGPSAVGFTIGSVAGDVPSTPTIVGSAATAGKTIQCNFSGLPALPPLAASAATNQCLVWSNTQTPIADGAIATITFAIPLSHGGQSDQFTLTNTGGASPAGVGIALAPGVMGTTAFMKSKCDIANTGSFTSADVALVVDAALSQNPSLTLFDLDSSGSVNWVDVQIEVIAALTGTCLAK